MLAVARRCTQGRTLGATTGLCCRAMSSSSVELNQANLAAVGSTGLQVPSYDRSALKTGIVHLGVGGFHRAHQAVYLNRLMNSAEGLASNASQWGVRGVGLLDVDSDLSSAFNSQDGLYSLTERGHEGIEDYVIGVHTGHLMASSQHKEVIADLVSPATRIVSITVTEKGYCFDSVTKKLNFEHPAIKAELEEGRPKTALGYILEGLEQRRTRNISPFTVMSCDNLPMNGDVVRSLVLEYAGAIKPELCEWIEANVSFPNSMVDRITPIPTRADSERLASEYNIKDSCAVSSEDFIQWVLEDNFVNDDRPLFEAAGVMVVKDVKPYELMKLRLLNGSHSALSYVSYLKGHREVDEAMSDPVIYNFVEWYMKELVQSVPPVPGVDLDDYIQTLLRRFSNPAIKDKVERLCQDGSVKLVGFTVPAIHELFRLNEPLPALALSTAGWIRYCKGADENNNIIQNDDPRAAELQQLAMAATMMAQDDVAGKETVRHFLNATYGPVCAMHEGFVSDVHSCLKDMMSSSVASVLESRVPQ